MNEHVDYSAKPASGATRFLWWCAGADKDILKYSSYADHVKYVGIGGILLATGILASFSMFFAINYIFEDLKIAIPLGLLLGTIIFYLNRFLLSSIGKGDGTVRITSKEFTNVIPRLAMAMILGFTISAPLEVYVFQQEIDKQLNKSYQEKQKLEWKKIEGEFTKSVDFIRLSNDQSTLQEEMKKLETEGRALDEKVGIEIQSGGCGPACYRLIQMRKVVAMNINGIKAKIQETNEQLQNKRKEKFENLSKVSNISHSLLDRLSAVYSIPGSYLPDWMRLMCLCLTLTPLLLKLTLVKSHIRLKIPTQ